MAITRKKIMPLNTKLDFIDCARLPWTPKWNRSQKIKIMTAFRRKSFESVAVSHSSETDL